MKKHLFITGPSGCGKTTVLRQELGEAIAYAGGFVTELRRAEDGSTLGYDLCPAASAAGVGNFETYRFLNFGNGKLTKDNEVFRGPGVKMLEEAVYYPFGVIDEFGGFEMVIPQFRNALADFLNSDLPIIGVVKDGASAAALQKQLGLGEKLTMLTDNLRAVLAQDEDTVLLHMKGLGDEIVRRIVKQWVSEYART